MGGSGSEPGIPDWWTNDTTQLLAIPYTSAGTPTLGLYEQVMTRRANLQFVEDSLILKKPSGQHHYGGQIFDTSLLIGDPARPTYDMLVTWISEGAICGGTASQCPP